MLTQQLLTAGRTASVLTIPSRIAYLVSPVLTGGDLGIDVSFWYKEYNATYGDEQFQVGYTTDETVTDLSEYTFGDVITASTAWQQYEGSFPAGTKRIAIKYIYGDRYYLFLDDFSFSAASSCPKPSGLTVGSITDVSAVVSWTSDADDFDLMVNGTLIENVTNPYTLTGLTPGENYAVQVRTHCGGTDYSDYTSAISFNTSFCSEEDQCVITYELADSYGDGWSGNAINVVDAESGNVLATLTIANGASAVGAVAVCPGREIQFQWVSGGTYSYPEECSYIIKNANSDEILNGSNTLSAPVSYVVDCTVSESKKPTNLTVSEVGPYSAVLSWTENGEATEWVVSCLNNDTDEENTVTATTNPFTLTGLDVNTEYIVKVRPAGDNEAWSDGVSFTTFFPVPATVTASNITVNSVDISWTADATATSATLQYAEGAYPAWNKYDNGTFGTSIAAGGSPFSYAVMFPAGSYVGNTLTKVSVFDYAAATGTVTIYNDGDMEPANEVGSKSYTLTGAGDFVEIDFDGLTIDDTKNVWVVLSNPTGAGVAAAPDVVDDVNGRWVYVSSWADLATAGVPGYVWMVRAEIGDDPATMTWTSVPNVTSPYTVTGLDEATNYSVRVKSVYDGGESEWSEAANFSTLASNPIPTNVEVANVLHNSATVSWEGERQLQGEVSHTGRAGGRLLRRL